MAGRTLTGDQQLTEEEEAARRDRRERRREVREGKSGTPQESEEHAEIEPEPAAIIREPGSLDRE